MGSGLAWAFRVTGGAPSSDPEGVGRARPVAATVPLFSDGGAPRTVPLEAGVLPPASGVVGASEAPLFSPSSGADMKRGKKEERSLNFFF